MIKHGNFVMQEVAVCLVEVDPLLDDGVIVLMQGNTGLIEGALTPEMAGFNYERIEFSVTVLIDPSADRVANTAGLNVRRPVVTSGIDSPVHVSVRPGNVDRFGSDDVQRIVGCHPHWHAG